MVCERSAGITRIGRVGRQRWSHVCASSAVAALLLAFPSDGRAQASYPGEATIPLLKHVHVPPCLVKQVQSMLQRSETFRAQMAAIARADGVGIAIAFDPAGRGPAAEAEIRRFTTGALLAVIRIRSTVDHAELLGHEMEHILEQIEGVPVVRLARTRKGAWATGNKYETERAIRVGRQVGREMRGGDAVTP
jgi:hypothetical protein